MSEGDRPVKEFQDVASEQITGRGRNSWPLRLENRDGKYTVYNRRNASVFDQFIIKGEENLGFDEIHRSEPVTTSLNLDKLYKFHQADTLSNHRFHPHLRRRPQVLQQSNTDHGIQDRGFLSDNCPNRPFEENSARPVLAPWSRVLHRWGGWRPRFQVRLGRRTCTFRTNMTGETPWWAKAIVLYELQQPPQTSHQEKFFFPPGDDYRSTRWRDRQLVGWLDIAKEYLLQMFKELLARLDSCTNHAAPRHPGT